jgi:DNA-binding transcriptional LysR family regulator
VIDLNSLAVFASVVEDPVWRLRGPDGDTTIRVNARVASDSLAFVLHAALSGVGVALLPESIVHAEFDAGRLKPVLDRYTTADVGIFAIYPSGRLLSTNVRAFLNLVEEMIQQTAPWRIDNI